MHDDCFLAVFAGCGTSCQIAVSLLALLGISGISGIIAFSVHKNCKKTRRLKCYRKYNQKSATVNSSDTRPQRYEDITNRNKMSDTAQETTSAEHEPEAKTVDELFYDYPVAEYPPTVNTTDNIAYSCGKHLNDYELFYDYPVAEYPPTVNTTDNIAYSCGKHLNDEELNTSANVAYGTSTK